MKRNGHRPRRAKRRSSQGQASPVHYLIAGFVVRRNGDCKVEAEVVPNRGVVEATYPKFGSGSPLADGERGILGFKEFSFSSRRNAPPKAKLEYKAQREFENSLTW